MMNELYNIILIISLHAYSIQVEKTLVMKKWSRNGKLIKQGRNVYDVLTM